MAASMKWLAHGDVLVDPIEVVSGIQYIPLQARLDFEYTPAAIIIPKLLPHPYSLTPNT